MVESSPVPNSISGYAQVLTQCSWKLMHGSSCKAIAAAVGSGAYADVLAWSRKSNASLLDQTESVPVFSSMVYSRAQVESRRGCVHSIGQQGSHRQHVGCVQPWPDSTYAPFETAPWRNGGSAAIQCIYSQCMTDSRLVHLALAAAWRRLIASDT